MSAPGFHCVIVPSLKSRSSGRAFPHIIFKLFFFFTLCVCVCVCSVLQTLILLRWNVLRTHTFASLFTATAKTAFSAKPSKLPLPSSKRWAYTSQNPLRRGSSCALRLARSKVVITHQTRYNERALTFTFRLLPFASDAQICGVAPWPWKVRCLTMRCPHQRVRLFVSLQILHTIVTVIIWKDLHGSAKTQSGQLWKAVIGWCCSLCSVSVRCAVLVIFSEPIITLYNWINVRLVFRVLIHDHTP